MITIALLQAHHLAWLAFNLIADSNDTDFSDLGKLMLGGFVLAVVVAIAVTFVRMHLRDKKPQATAEFISISSFQRKKTGSN